MKIPQLYWGIIMENIENYRLIWYNNWVEERNER
jgi:hypothetical protein